jgi:SET domain-containing protein
MPKFYRQESPISGQGLFTRVKIPEGSVILAITGKLVATDDLSDDVIRKGLLQGVAPGWALVSANGVRSHFSYINHAQECNCVVDLVGRQVVALRDIEADEELTLDYEKEPFDARVRSIVYATLGLTVA